MHTTLLRVVREHGTPCFVYFRDDIKSRVESLRAAFGRRFKISYAVKANPNIAMLLLMAEWVEMLDISSGGELDRTMRAAWNPERISFTGPGKTDKELQAAVDRQVGLVVVESVNEARRLATVAEKAGQTQPVLIRISPINMPEGFGLEMSGKPVAFGIDEENMDAAIEAIKKLPNLALKGFHIYSGTQCLHAASILENYRNFIAIFRRAAQTHAIRPETLIFGSGLGIPYHEYEKELDLAKIAQEVNPIIDEMQQEERFSETSFVLETGRYLVGAAGYYLTRVINMKHSRGRQICICDGGMNHNLAASGNMGSVLKRNYLMFKLGADALYAQTPQTAHDIVGPLCTTIDRLGSDVKLPEMHIGDVIAVRSCGAYGLTASPIHFISHEAPKEILVGSQESGVPVLHDISEIGDCAYSPA